MTNHTPLTDQQLNDIEARANAATPGPWTADSSIPYGHRVGSSDEADWVAWTGEHGETGSEADAAFIAAMNPETAKALAGEVRRLRAALVDQADADTVAARAAQAISDMGADLRAARAERDRYRAAWQSARFRAQAYGEGIERVVKDRESYQGWLKQAEARVAELERPAVEAKRNEIRQSYVELISQAEQDRDFEGKFDVQCQLRDREEQWQREDAAPASVPGL